MRGGKIEKEVEWEYREMKKKGEVKLLVLEVASIWFGV